MLHPRLLADVTMGLEAHLNASLKEATANVTPDETEQLQIAGAVLTLMLRHYVQACVDPNGWLEGCIRAVLEP